MCSHGVARANRRIDTYIAGSVSIPTLSNYTSPFAWFRFLPVVGRLRVSNGMIAEGA